MKENIRLVQLSHPIHGRKVALVQEPLLILLDAFTSVYALALKAINTKTSLQTIIEDHLSNDKLTYDDVCECLTEWKILPSFDHPENPFACLVSGTGLTHKNSALNRQVMHQSGKEKLTDSMKMYQWGLEGGRPQGSYIGTQPEWFYKGTGAILKGHGDVLKIPAYANDGGEEPEVAGVYIVDENGIPYRIGFTTGNEFSDHVMERKNYLYLAPSKLRQCAIGPELVVDENFNDLTGTVSIRRKDETIWSAAIHTGEENMAHSLANLEYHHFKYEDHRQPFQAHVHFFGADAFSFGAGMVLQDGDEMSVHWEALGRPLHNTVSVDAIAEEPLKVEALHASPAKHTVNK